MPKVTATRKRASPPARPSLEAELAHALETGTFRPAGITSKRQKRPLTEDDESDDAPSRSQLLPKSLSNKVLRQAQSQQREEQEEQPAHTELKQDEEARWARAARIPQQMPSLRAPSLRGHKRRNGDNDVKDHDGEDSDAAEEEEEEEDDEAFEHDPSADLQLTAEDEASLSQFLPTASEARQNLADLISNSIAKHESTLLSSSSSSSSSSPSLSHAPLDPKVVAVYTQVGVYLSHYTSGKVPKAFKIIPSLINWEQVLFLTAPESWTCQAIAVASRLFAANLNEKMAQRFFHIILFPRVRLDISQHGGKLNYHLYQAMRHAIFKPAAFYRALVLPMCQQELTVKEAVIVSSVLNKYSIAPLHSAVCMMKLTELEYSGPVCLVLKTLINKKYALPLRVVNELCDYFHSFVHDERKMPLIWHQTLLVFVQRYKAQFTEAQRRQIRELCRHQIHAAIGKDIKREMDAIALGKQATLHSSSLLNPPAPREHKGNKSSDAAAMELS